MKLVLKAFLGVCLLFPVSSAVAIELVDILRQGVEVFVETQGNKSNVITDAERRKNAVDDDVHRRVTAINSQITANNRRIDEELDPQLQDALRDLRALERDRNDGLISRNEYANEKRSLDNTVRNLRNSITVLKQQNAGLERNKDDLLTNAERQKMLIDENADANISQADKRRNTNILEQLQRDMRR